MMRITVCIGNPGTGKSSTLNCYLERKCFKSGISKTGAGVTYQLDVKEHDGQKWMDTPGLSCMKYRKAAATAINEALAQGGLFRFVFVLTIESGRVRPDDITTISLVMQACNAQEPQIGDDDYAIFINKTSNKWLEQMDQKSREDWTKNNFSAPFQEKGIPTTKMIYFAPFIEEMDDADNKLVPLCPQTRGFIDNLPEFQIDPAKVGQVDAKDFDEKSREVNEMQDKLKEKEKETQAIQELAKKDHDARMLAEARASQAEHTLALKERQAEESMRGAASAKADVDAAALRRQKEEEELGRRRRGKITAKKEGKAAEGGFQLWGGEAEDIVMVNDTGVAVNFSTNLGNKVNVPPGSSESSDWAYNAIWPWATPDVTVDWVAATEPEQCGTMTLQAGEVLRLSQ